ncbi:hypothetical protein ACS0TY_003922 [Phlomoides rotata]
MWIESGCPNYGEDMGYVLHVLVQCLLAGFLKLNSDAASFKNGNGGFNFLVRNGRGEVVLAGTKGDTVLRDSMTIEAVALRFALHKTLEHNISEFHVETDSECLVRHIKGELEDDAYLDLIVQDIKLSMERNRSRGYPMFKDRRIKWHIS